MYLKTGSAAKGKQEIYFYHIEMLYFILYIIVSIVLKLSSTYRNRIIILIKFILKLFISKEELYFIFTHTEILANRLYRI